jgi:DNA-binding LacI/PurR family transcriptional regulator
LTTIAQPIEELGQHAVDMLVKLIEQQPNELMTKVFASDLIIRESA